nr:SDR family oxidoreductase [Burkholderia aenigmatica]
MASGTRSPARTRAGCPHPSIRRTSCLAAASARTRAASARRRCRPRRARPSSASGAVAWLAGPRASFVTGATIAVNGGWRVG